MSDISSLPAELRQSLLVLKLGWPTTAEELSLAFRKAALEAHPDRGGSDDQMKQVNRAQEVVKKALASGPTDRWGNPWDRDNPWYHADFARRWGGQTPYAERQRREDARRNRETPRYPPAEHHEYIPPANARESFERSRDAGKRSEFCNLSHWQKSRTNSDNLTRQVGKHRLTIYYRDGEYGWVVSEIGERGGKVSEFSTHRYKTRAEAVNNLADVLEIPYEYPKQDSES